MATVGRYRLLEEVARGGMGAVHRAAAPDGTVVALKLLLAGRGAAEGQRRRFELEVQALLRLRHPGVVRLLDAGEHAGCPWLAMEWVDGETLAARLAREGPLDPRDAARLVAELARALEHCHAQGVLHRDLKPENVLLRRADRAPLLTDFGLTRDLARDSLSGTAHSVQGQLLGTPGYWPPEQARGETDAIGPRSDVWGLGAVLFALLTGDPPVQATTLVEALVALERAPKAPSAVRRGVPAALDAVCARCLVIDPAGRYPGATAVALDLERWLRGEGPVGRPRRAPIGAALVALVGLTALATVVGSGVAPEAAEEQPAPASGPSEAPATSLAPATDPAPEESAARVAQASALHQRAQVTMGRGDVEGAMRDLELALAIAPELPGSWLNRGVGRMRKGDLPGALEDLERAIELDPRNPKAWVNRGGIHGQLGDDARAVQDFDRALELDPRSFAAFKNRGLSRERLGDAKGAEADLGRALELFPDDRDTRRKRAEVRAKLGDRRGALEDLDRLVAQLPQEAADLINRGVHHIRANDGAAARADFERAAELDPGSVLAHSNLALLAEREGDGLLAILHYDRALEADPKRADLLQSRGVLLAGMGDAAAARRDFDRVIELAPRSANAHLNRGLLRRNQGDREGALQDFERALTLEPTPAGRADLEGAIAQLRAELGR